MASLTVLQRGWLSSNNILLRGEPGEGAVLVDSGHCVHAEQTLALVEHALQGERLHLLVNTHLHSDHCGGNVRLQQTHAVPVWVPPGQAEAARTWDETALSYQPTGQRCERFEVHGVLQPGTALRVGSRQWQVIAAPGHDPHSVMLFEAEQGVLLSADALWENGFGVVFPELEGESAFDDVAAVLDLIEHLPVRQVVPGHGAPFGDVPAALQRARQRLAMFRADPARHARHAAKVLIKYHLMEEGRQPYADVLRWAEATPLIARTQQTAGDRNSLPAWCAQLAADLVGAGALQHVEGWLLDA
jgi:glyoxylase-like metal-dependent hydrolase (beta-lactamase superfamily II)